MAVFSRSQGFRSALTSPILSMSRAREAAPAPYPAASSSNHERARSLVQHREDGAVILKALTLCRFSNDDEIGGRHGRPENPGTANPLNCTDRELAGVG
jgi:hypothetical protein